MQLLLFSFRCRLLQSYPTDSTFSLEEQPVYLLQNYPRELHQGHDSPPPAIGNDCFQKAWDILHVQATYNSLLLSSPNIVSRSRLLAAARSESGIWIHTFSMSAIGLRMDDDIVCVAIRLRLGGSLCRPHSCVHCGNQVDHLGHHVLRCRMSQGRHPRHVAINDIIQRALTSAKIPSHLEPIGTYRSD